jgi:AcrR family transcriptional regulator
MTIARLSRKDSQEMTRARLRRSAIQAFARHGISGSRIDAIAEGAGYSRGAFYSNYRTKLDLLVDLLREKQIGEIQLWQDVLSHTNDIHADMALLSARYDGLSNVRERAMLNSELQLEADRNEAFRPAFQAYLDSAYAEMRLVFALMFERHGKQVPGDLDSLVVTTRLLGLGLGSPSILGMDIAARTSPGRVMFEFLSGVMASALPAIDTHKAGETQ